MAKRDEQPELNTDQEVVLTLAQIIDLAKSMNQQQGLTPDMVAEIAAKATAAATASIAGPKDDYRNDPKISVFNPLGDRDHPRPELLGDIYWAGYLLRGDELTKHEIDLLNQVQPGDFEIMSRDGGMLPFKVRDLDPGSKDVRKLLILFPCMTADQRMSLPNMVEMLAQVVSVPA